MENILKIKDKKLIKVVRGPIFDTDRLQIDLGIWLGLFNQPQHCSYYEWESLLKGRLVNLAREGMVKPEVLNSIQDKFLELVNPVLNGETIFSLYNYDHDKGTFKCEYETGKNVNMKFSFGWIEEGPMFTIENDKEKTVYDFYEGRDDRKAQLQLRSYTKKLGPDFTFHHYVFDRSYYACLSDRNRTINITIDYKKDVPVSEQVNKELLEKYISELTLDASLEEISAAVVKGIIGDPKSVNAIKIDKKALVIEHHGCSPVLKTQEMITFEKGEIKDLLFIRNGKNIHINDFTAWSYKDNQFYVSGNDDKQTYSVTVTADSDKLDDAIVPRTYVKTATEEVQKIKKLTLTPLNGDNK